MFLVGNKIDLKNKREISEEEARTFAEERNMVYFESSAKEDINIENVF
jgi:GTPase SAR1 family protein